MPQQQEGGPACHSDFSNDLKESWKWPNLFPSPPVTEMKISMEQTTELDVNVRHRKYIKLKAFGLVSDCMFFFTLCTDIWPLL